MTIQETKEIVLAGTELSAYEAVDCRESREQFLTFALQGHESIATNCDLTLQEITKFAGLIYDRALEEKNDPAINWDQRCWEIENSAPPEMPGLN